jgi:hypothetical protein
MEDAPSAEPMDEPEPMEETPVEEMNQPMEDAPSDEPMNQPEPIDTPNP